MAGQLWRSVASCLGRCVISMLLQRLPARNSIARICTMSAASGVVPGPCTSPNSPISVYSGNKPCSLCGVLCIDLDVVVAEVTPAGNECRASTSACQSSAVRTCSGPAQDQTFIDYQHCHATLLWRVPSACYSMVSPSCALVHYPAHESLWDPSHSPPCKTSAWALAHCDLDAHCPVHCTCVLRIRTGQHTTIVELTPLTIITWTAPRAVMVSRQGPHKQ
jgi:hypothetical protein